MKSLETIFEIVEPLAQFLSAYPEPTNVRGYSVFPEANELEGWIEDDPAWPATWFPLTPKLHFVTFYLDTADAQVKLLGAFREPNEEGFYEDGKLVYDSLSTFQEVVELNAHYLNPFDAFVIPPEGGDPAVAVLDPNVAAQIEQATAHISGPSILPFFYGTLGEFDAMANPDVDRSVAW